MRSLLHITKLDAFKKYLTKNGIKHRPGKGDYQKLQVEHKGHWLGIYWRHGMKEHFTTDRRLDGIVARFCRDRNESIIAEDAMREMFGNDSCYLPDNMGNK